MKYSVSRAAITAALARVQGIATKNAMASLANVLIEGEADGPLRVAATDLNVTRDGTVGAAISEGGRVTVDARRLFDVVRSMPGEQVDVVVNAEHQVEVTSRNSKFVIHGTSGDDYPLVASVSGVEMAQVDSEALKAMLDRTAFSASTEDSRPNLGGVFFERLGGGLARAVTTDGHRLSQCERNIGEGAPHAGVIIPNKGAAELRKMLDDAGPSVSLGFADGQVAVSDGAQHMFIRLIDANFPDYAQVIPKATPSVVVIEREPFVSALKRIGIMASDRTHGVRIDLKAGRMVMTSDDPQSGSSRDEMEIEYDGPEMAVGLNSRYVRDALAVMTSERVDLALVDALSPCVIREHGCEDSLCLVMPMRL